jgi:hypothetical protein
VEGISVDTAHLCGLKYIVFIFSSVTQPNDGIRILCIRFRTDFFLFDRARAIYRPTHQVLSTNIRSHTEFIFFFIFDPVRVLASLVNSAFSVRHGWRI